VGLVVERQGEQLAPVVLAFERLGERGQQQELEEVQ
jgi:hypothetical protein